MSVGVMALLRYLKPEQKKFCPLDPRKNPAHSGPIILNFYPQNV